MGKDKKLRLGFVSAMEAVPWGGSEELWSQAALHLMQDGVTVGANVAHWPAPVPQVVKLQAAGCQITHRRPPNRLQRRFPRLQSDWLDQFRPDLVIVSQGCPTNGVDWIERCMARKIPFAIVVQAAGERFVVEDPLAALLAEGFATARGLYFVSEGNIHFVRRQLAAALPHAKTVRNPFAVSYDAAPAWPTGDGNGNGPLKLACVARLDSASKGQELLLDVLKGEKWRSRPIEVTFFGSGPNARTLENLRRMYGLANVKFGGFTDNVEAIWQTHHALVLPSRVEGLPLAVVEAMLCGRVCVVTNVAGNAELMEDGRSGFVAGAATVESIDQALERAWEHRADWPHIGKAAAQRVRTFVPRDPARAFANDLLALAD